MPDVPFPTLDMPGAATPPLELWGGVECTVNRIGDRFADQLRRSGHHDRADDLDAFAALGVRALRMPVLWERVVPLEGAAPDWRWSDARLARLRELGIRPIVGLVHHGSGPRHTHLLDPEWPAALAHYAHLVAERYPWVTDWTPVNEPLTTARFSALYGHWYPHAADDRAFALALLHQIEGVRRAMRAIRAVIPGARLVQTDDLGKTHATPRVARQAAFENERRWVTFDLLAGRVVPGTAMWEYLHWNGANVPLLDALRAEPCAPDLLGLNHYLTSERFLDDRLEHYPAHVHGGNGRDRYVDVEAVRVRAEGCDGPGRLLREAWERYARPMAITEAHLGCTREQQLRWIAHVWRDARAARADGVDVRAVTLWALLGSHDWASLLTREDGHYEPGAFDVRAPRPRATAIARAARALADGRLPDHPALDGPGWWEVDDRLLYPAFATGERARRAAGPLRPPRPILVTGASGTLGRALARQCAARGLEHRLLGRVELDIADPGAIDAALARHRPWAVINAAGYVRVDAAESDVRRCLRENRDGPAALAAACADRGIALVTFSSDLVFDGRTERPYVESDPTVPLNAYGASKAAAERLVLARAPEALVVRTSAFFGPWDTHNFAHAALSAIARGEPFVASEDEVVSPTYVPDLADAVLDLLVDGERGVWHLANQGAVSWAALARAVATEAGLDPGAVEGRITRGRAAVARRPTYSALGSERGWLLPTVENAICRYAAASAARVIDRARAAHQTVPTHLSSPAVAGIGAPP